MTHSIDLLKKTATILDMTVETGSKFVPIAEASTDRIKTNLYLPFNLDEKIGLNLGRIGAMMQLGGFKHLTISREPEEKTSSTIPTIVGMSGSGDAIAGKVKSKIVETYNNDFSLERNELRSHTWSDLKLRINTHEIQQRVLLSERNVRDATTWASEIDEALTKGIVRAGFDYLIHTRSNMDKVGMSVSYVLYGAALVVNKLLLGTSFAIPGYLGALAAYNLGFLHMQVGREKRGTGQRLSVFIDYELDRAIVLRLVGKLSTLAKALPEKPPQSGK